MSYYLLFSDVVTHCHNRRYTGYTNFSLIAKVDMIHVNITVV